MLERVNNYLNNKLFRKRGFGSIGRGSKIGKRAYFQNKQHIYIGDKTTILSGSRLQSYSHLVKEIPKIKIGNHCYIGFGFSVLAGADITIGDRVLIASNVLIASENHSIDPESDIAYMDQKLVTAPVVIGEGSWVGEKVIILPGVTVGKKSVIGGGSVVTKSIPDYCIAAGNPARVIKKYNFKKHEWEKVIS